MQLALCVLLLHSSATVGDDDDKSPAAGGDDTTMPTLNGDQQQAAGIRVAHPRAVTAPGRIEAFGLVLDATTLLSDVGDVTVLTAAEHSASAELVRLRALYQGGAGASLKMLQAAQTEYAKSQAQAELASARFTLHWGPLSALASEPRRRIVDAATNGRSLLLRADWPGRHSVAMLPDSVLLNVDGIRVPGRILGVLRQYTELQNAGLLVEIRNAPAGLGPGARVPLALLMPERTGVLLPRDAVLYGEKGAYVYRQVNGKTGQGKVSYAPVKVNLLVPYGDGWLANGVDDDDNIVMQGAGVLWTLQGVDVQRLDDDDD